MKFYIGMRTLGHAWAFPRVMIPVTKLVGRWQGFVVNKWMMDSGGFSQILHHGKFDMTPRGYAAAIRQWSECGELVGAVAQDWMCDPVVRRVTGKSTEEHQEMTIQNYVDLIPHVNGTRIIPVIQGFKSAEYARHVRQYGDLLTPGQWVAVGSLVSRSNDPVQMLRILEAVKSERPDLHLHGFGLKSISLKDKRICDLLYSSDSIAWSSEGRFQSWKVYAETNGNKKKASIAARAQFDPRIAMRYAVMMQRICDEGELVNWWSQK